MSKDKKHRPIPQNARRRKRWATAVGSAALFVLVTLITLTLGDRLPGDIPGWSGLGCEPPQSAGVSSGDMVIHAVDVGQGDCVLVQADGANILIDAGENGYGETVVRYLRRHGVDHIDLAMCSHPHTDHIGGMDRVIERIRVDAVMMPEIPDELTPTTMTYSDLLDAAYDRDIPIIWANAGYETEYGRLKLSVLSPESGRSYESLNDWSLALRMECGGCAFLSCGDVTALAESDILASGCELDADIMKVSHHGSSLSNSEEFIDAVSPRYAFVMCGAGNDYGHPHDAAMRRLRERGVTVFRTDISGNTVFTYRAISGIISVEQERTSVRDH